MENQRNGIYLSIKYLGFRKRKPVPWGCAANNFEECFDKAKNWMSENKGKFISGGFMPCTLYEIDFKGEKITMQSVAYISPKTMLNEKQIQELNGN